MKGYLEMTSLSTKVGTDASLQDGGVFFRTFRDLLKQREALDHQILRLQGNFFQHIEQRTAPTSLPAIEAPKRYVPRMQNHTILADAIRDCMVPGVKMGMKEILLSLQTTGSYQTQSTYFYTMVNNKLNRDPLVVKVSRGVFVLQSLTEQVST